MRSTADAPLIVTRPVWGTVVRIEVRDALDPRALDDVWSWFDRVDRVFSTWRVDSDIARIARGELSVTAADPDVALVLERCEELRRASDGAFDVAFAAGEPPTPTCGRGPLDPTGYVKGWAVDRAAARIHARGSSHFSINAGGDIVVRAPSRATAWRIGLQDPTRPDAIRGMVTLTDGAVATSGAYERGEHVFDARTGRIARGLASVSVVGPDLATADGHATAALALGVEGMEWLSTQPRVEAFAITDAGDACSTPGFDRFRGD
ncbi:MAG TPA: FAD:protein FMN transferase [Acidimicrobiia bacterium]|nr:FAD:protein FMN transferase [Acidimicrobiia bacterium]